MRKDIKDYLNLYLNHQVEVQKKDDPGNKLIGRICEVTCGSNHSDWIKVRFDTCVEVYTSEWGKSFSNAHTYFINYDHIRLLLRPLSDMTEEEIAYKKSILTETENLALYEEQVAEMFRYMLSKGFDLFGLIEAGLAIDKTKEVHHA